MALKRTACSQASSKNITDINEYVWRFCINYIALNSITKVIAYPIPRCDQAVHISFGGSILFWLLDCPSGFHQMKVAPESQEKLAFAGPYATKYTYLVMPFGIVNGPTYFIDMIFDLRSTWSQLATSRGLDVGDRTNSRIIVDDIFGWAATFQCFLTYFECQLQVCLSQNLSLSLKKSIFLPK